MPLIDSNTPAGQQPDIPLASGYSLVFSDEFLNASLDPKWQVFTDFGNFAVPSNWDISGGRLRVWPNSATNYNNWTMRSSGSPSFTNFTYGVWECRVKLCRGRGIFPAFWAYKHPDANPQCEIDIFEAYGYDGGGWNDGAANGWRPTNAAWTIWIDGGGPPTVRGDTLKLSDASLNGWPSSPVDLSAGFHTYTLKWEPDGLTFYFDGVQWGSKTGAPWTQTQLNGQYGPCAVVLDLWFRLAGLPEPSAANTPSGTSNAMEWEYVRVWALPGTSTPPPANTKLMPLGDSLTEGQSSTLNYRHYLSNLYNADGVSTVDFVGSMTSNGANLASNRDNHEGHSGWCSTDAGGICQQGNASWDPSRPIGIIQRIEGWMSANTADIVLLLVGLNDADKDSLHTNVRTIVNSIHSANSACNVYVSGIRQQGFNYDTVNANIRSAISAVSATFYVSAYAGITESEWADTLHLNASGYAKMAQNWYSAIQAPFSATLAQAPASSATLTGIVQFEVTGTRIANVELYRSATADGTYARFTVNAQGFNASLNWDTTSLSNGTVVVSIAAYDVPPGSVGSVISVMANRTYIISNVTSSEMPVLTFMDMGF